MSKITTSLWDPADYLDSPEVIQEYLQSMLEECGIDGFKKALGDVARARGMGDLAKQANLGRQSLYKSLSEDGNPSFKTVCKILLALGYSFNLSPVQRKRI